MTNNVVIVTAGEDWAAVYRNGELYWQGEMDHAVEYAWEASGFQEIDGTPRYANDLDFPRYLNEVERV